MNRRLETKWFIRDIAVSEVITTSWKNVSACIGLGEGTSAITRIGQKVRLKRIEYIVAIQPVLAGTEKVGSRCRVILYHNKQANGAPMAPTSLFDSNDILSLRNITQMRRCSVLKEHVHHMSVIASDGAGTNSSAGPPIQFKWTIYPKTVLQYTSNAGAEADILKDDYGIGWISDDAGCCTISVRSKLVFTDA